jgi:hypothetical protein
MAVTASATTASLIIGVADVPILAQRGAKSTDPGKARKKAAAVVHREDEGQVGRGRKSVRRPEDPAVIDVFKDFNAWWDDDRDGATLAALGKVQGVDHFVHPVAELADGISPNTDVVLITSNSWGQESTRIDQNDPSAQANLAGFVRRGGVAIVDMGDNDYYGGFMAPGAVGTPDLVFPSDGANATLAGRGAGADGVVGTADDHRLVRGPDGAAGTADDLNDSNIDACCYVAHGNLRDGIVIPPSATILMTAAFDGIAKPILAEYCMGYGRVILDTVTKEFAGHDPVGQGASRFMLSLLSYAMDPVAQTDCGISGLIESVRWMRPDNIATALEAKLASARADVERGKHGAAAGKLRAFANAVRAQRGRALPAPLADEWIGVAGRISAALRH